MIKGFDLSHWEGQVNFTTAKSRGIGFSYTKATEGVSYTDSTFKPNHANAKACGMARGAFHFLRWNCSPEAQADYFWNVIKADPGELPPCVDYEENRADGIVLPTPEGALEILAKFVGRLESLCGRVPVIYTGESFWKEHGSTDSRWARYPLWFAHPDLTPPPLLAPWQDWTIWQYSWTGDDQGNGQYYGASALGLDMDYTTEAKLSALMGTGQGDTNMWKENAIGLYTKEATWTNTGFHFIIGHAGQSYSEPNQQLKPIEERAAAMKQTFMLLWDFSVDYYRKNQFPMDESRWPTLDVDWPYIYFTRALAARNYKAVMIRVMNPLNDGGNTEDPNFISFAASQFVARISGWLSKNRPGVPLVLVTSNDFVSQYAPAMNNWAYKYNSCIEQPAVQPLDQSFPQTEDKIKNYISVRPTWEFWYYFNGSISDLFLYNGTPAKLAELLGISTLDLIPPTAPGNFAASVNGNVASLSWSPSTDNVGVAGYTIYLDGASLRSASGTSAQVSGLAVGSHTIELDAYDAAGNHSTRVTTTVTVAGQGDGDLTLLEQRVAAVEGDLVRLKEKLAALGEGLSGL